ncbi:hypothetical protein GKQ38_05530 [Candidatus Nanohaloarchaea archaeon]|nr:hypothetical protein GKQ38_05530 [Candidatus Nanohaloarchaea archaeon]
MPKARSVDFTEEFQMLNGEGVKEERLDPVEVSGNEIPALDFDTTVHHLRRNNYDVDVSPNGGSLDAEGQTGTKHLDISSLNDGAVQVKFSIDIEEAERRRDEEIEDPEAYVEKVYGQIVDELVEREEKIERASENYVSNLFEYDNPVEQLESDFKKHGDSAEEVIDSYFGDMRPSELGLTYAVHFELHPGETVDNERRNLDGKMPLYDALNDEDAEDRDRLYFQRYLGKVLEKADERAEISDELREYWQDLA